MKEIGFSFMIIIFCFNGFPNVKLPYNFGTNDTNVKDVIEGVRSKKGKVVIAVFKD